MFDKEQRLTTCPGYTHMQACIFKHQVTIIQGTHRYPWTPAANQLLLACPHPLGHRRKVLVTYIRRGFSLELIAGLLNEVIYYYIPCFALVDDLGYYATGTETYDIKWSMPQCVLTLRLIGLAFDLYDGKKPAELLSNDQKKAALSKIPSLLEVAGHTYFPSSFLVGPQFSMRRYQDFVSGEFREKMLPFVKKCLVLGFWGKMTLYKYISCWLISEGVCICSGLTYNGKTPDGQIKWDGCANVKLRVFEGATKFGHFIASFNINTNNWVSQYVYKRLKFMGNRYISQAAALMFLAVWHGLHTGYYMCFAMEFLVMKLEKDLEQIIQKSEAAVEFFKNPLVQIITWIILKLYTFVFMGWCLIPFALLSFPRWWQIQRGVDKAPFDPLQVVVLQISEEGQ
uniref:Lysophospholipid acyltransferase 5 n=1 Tax=Timema shepardi TaxID=629360 RepID=A0A7R9B185_TIMSH|nr:unnamed protein product [Timema shepardi]